MAHIDNVSLDIAVVLGATDMPVHQVLRLGRGAIIELDASENDEVKILANNFPEAGPQQVTVLMYAAQGGKLPVVDRLLAAGAVPTARDVQDWSALDFALLAGAAYAQAPEKPRTYALVSAIGPLDSIRRIVFAHDEVCSPEL